MKKISLILVTILLAAILIIPVMAEADYAIDTPPPPPITSGEIPSETIDMEIEVEEPTQVPTTVESTTLPESTEEIIETIKDKEPTADIGATEPTVSGGDTIVTTTAESIEDVTIPLAELKLDDVIVGDGTKKTLRMKRDDAVERFNDGRARFLIATEAGGEGIDLQSRCHSMIHIDLPWNPMRMHQRVGRLNRYGQEYQVEIFTIRNPDTVESHIWNLLNEKIDRIMLAVGQAMDEPEDLLQLVLGMTSPSFFREIFTEGTNIEREKLSQWFDSKASNFGGKDVVDTVRELVGHCSKFDFQQVSEKIPQVDLPDLLPFFLATLENNSRRYDGDKDTGFQFKTPENWCPADITIRDKYSGILFNRQYGGKDAMKRVLGVGHKLFDVALEQAKRQIVSVSLVPPKLLESGIFIFKIADRITSSGMKKSLIVAVAGNSEVQLNLLSDWNLLLILNKLASDRGQWRRRVPIIDVDAEMVENISKHATVFLNEKLSELDLDMQVPVIELLGILWPGIPVSEKEIAETKHKSVGSDIFTNLPTSS